MLSNHGAGTTTALKVGNKVRVQTSYPDGCERVEEWGVSPSSSSSSSSSNTPSLQLLVRRWRSPDKMGKVQPWDFEVGELAPLPPSPSLSTLSLDDASPLSAAALSAAAAAKDASLISSNTTLNPSFLAQDAPRHFVFAVRNCPWPLATYSLSVDAEKDELVLRTSNKKYFKRWRVPALVRMAIAHDESCLDMRHLGDKENVLVISYEKPRDVIKQEEAEAKERDAALRKVMGGGAPDPEACKQS
jgi:hypothetical protein